jgi:hypothetical protein
MGSSTSIQASSTELERTIIEASALLVTLVFIIAEVGETWKNPVSMQWLSIVGFLFIGAIIASVLRMIGEFAPDILRAFYGLQILFFIGGLTMLAMMFFAGGFVGSQGNTALMLLYLVYITAAGVMLAYSERRRLRKLKQPMIS